MKKLGFGCMRLPVLDPGDVTTIDMPQFEKMVDTFLERGFTYFDTAYVYHSVTSEKAVREALVKRHPRDSFTLATKLPLIKLGEAADSSLITSCCTISIPVPGPLSRSWMPLAGCASRRLTARL